MVNAQRAPEVGPRTANSLVLGKFLDLEAAGSLSFWPHEFCVPFCTDLLGRVGLPLPPPAPL